MKIKNNIKNIFQRPVISPDALNVDDINYIHENFLEEKLDVFIPSKKEEDKNIKNISVLNFLKGIIKI